MLLICIIDFSTDKHSIKGSSFWELTFILRIPFFKIAIWNFDEFFRHIIEKSIMQMSNMC